MDPSLGVGLWIIAGGLVGWSSSVLTRTSQRQGGVANVFAGVISALAGGILGVAVSARTGRRGLMVPLLFAIVTSLLATWIWRLVYRHRLRTGSPATRGQGHAHERMTRRTSDYPHEGAPPPEPPSARR